MSVPVSKTSRNGVLFVARWEGMRLSPYNDVGGNATVGVGHLLHRGRVTAADRRQWATLTREGALELLTHDLGIAERALVELVHPPLTSSHHFDALASFVFNVGTSAFANSTLRQKLNTGARGVPAADELLRWTHVDGVQVEGLLRRRLAERAVYLHGDYLSEL